MFKKFIVVMLYFVLVWNGIGIEIKLMFLLLIVKCGVFVVFDGDLFVWLMIICIVVERMVSIIVV